MSRSASDTWYALVARLGLDPELFPLTEEEAREEFLASPSLEPPAAGSEPDVLVPRPPLSSRATQELVRRIEEGSHEDGEELFRRYGALLSVMVRMRIPRQLLRHHQTEEVLESAFFSVLTEIRRFRYEGEGSFRRWLTSLVVNRLRDDLRYQQHATRSSDRETTADLRRPLRRTPPEPGESAASTDHQARTIDAMSRLAEEDQEILCMRIFEKMSWEQISDVQAAPAPRVRKHYEEAVLRLTRLLS